MGWGERQTPHEAPQKPIVPAPWDGPTGASEAQLAAAASHRERELELEMTRIALVATKALHDVRALPSDEAAVLAADALRAIEKLATKKASDAG